MGKGGPETDQLSVLLAVDQMNAQLASGIQFNEASEKIQKLFAFSIGDKVAMTTSWIELKN